MNRRHLQLLTPFLLLAWLLAQNGMALVQMLADWSGHEVVSTWHGGHYDVVMNHGHDGAGSHTEITSHPETRDACLSDCGHHFDLKPVGPATPDAKNKSLLISLLVLLPALLCWLLPLLRETRIGWRLPQTHRNTLPLLIRSTVLRH
jgi:hypothetical protein